MIRRARLSAAVALAGAVLTTPLEAQATGQALTASDQEAQAMGLQMAFACSPRRHGEATGTTSTIRREADALPGTAIYFRSIEGTFVALEEYDAELNGLDEATLVLFRSTDGGATWMPAGGAADGAANTVTVTGLDAFSRWTAASSPAPLPVELSSFTAATDGEAVVLSIPKMVVEQLLDMHKISSVRLLRILCGLVAQRLREIDDKLVGWYILSGGSDAPEVR